MSQILKRAICAVLLAGAGIFPCGEALAEVSSSRVAAVTAARQREDFARLFDSAKGLNEALKRVSKQNAVDNDTAKTLFPAGWDEKKPYLRVTKQPNK